MTTQTKENIAILRKNIILNTVMFYSHPCSYCSKIFYTFSDSRYEAAKMLYAGIKLHLQQYDEDDKEHKFDDLPEVDIDEVEKEMTESSSAPAGGYQL